MFEEFKIRKLETNAFFHRATVDKPLVIKRKRRIPLRTRFLMMKLKIDVSVFSLFSIGCYQLLVAQNVLLPSIIKRKCKTAFSIKFKTLKLKADT